MIVLFRKIKIKISLLLQTVSKQYIQLYITQKIGNNPYFLSSGSPINIYQKLLAIRSLNLLRMQMPFLLYIDDDKTFK